MSKEVSRGTIKLLDDIKEDVDMLMDPDSDLRESDAVHLLLKSIDRVNMAAAHGNPEMVRAATDGLVSVAVGLPTRLALKMGLLPPGVRRRLLKLPRRRLQLPVGRNEEEI